ncbi:MAG: hypothetical protein Ct9H300mP18_09780 [Candidatus Neomarinimicrobiota bacterium]|nr:MAG: hypothetical protein Ct9H300mP18_09780 [Candidatus Neomarinimicrobiota bacterium]
MKGFLTVHNDEGYAAWLPEQQEYLEEEETMIGETTSGKIFKGKII